MTTETLMWILMALVAIAVVLQIILLMRKPSLAPLESLRERLENQLRDEQRAGRTELSEQLTRMNAQQAQTIESLRASLQEQTARTQELARENADRIRVETRQDAEQFRTQMLSRQDTLQSALGDTLKNLTDKNETSLIQVRTDLQTSQHNLQQSLQQSLTNLRDSNTQTLTEVRSGLSTALESLQKDNAEKLERMRETVDEKLSSTLNERLDSSFKQVSERLESVQRGLGEMQELASGVGDLKRVLTNVKSRGMFGETQLSMLLEQVFTQEQYGVNVATVPGSSERVEFAIKFPGRGEDNSFVWLPIDSKFPNEDYERLLAAQEAADKAAVDAAGAALELTIRGEAKKIADKYVQAPYTTDFAILFLPTESLYAEVLRRPALFERLQREHKVTVAGPTTLLALLNALQLGFRSIAIEKRSSDVWNVLSKVKVEFGKYADMVEKADKQLGTVRNTLSDNAKRTRALERSLRDVQVLDHHVADDHKPLGLELDGDGEAEI